MSSPRTGIWIIGAWGGVATTTAVGLASLQNKITNDCGLVSELPPFQNMGLSNWDQFVIGGHEIRETNFETEARILLEKSHVFSEAMIQNVSTRLKSFDENVQPGNLHNVGEMISSFATQELQDEVKTPVELIDEIVADISEFRVKERLSSVIVLNLASTEPNIKGASIPETWDELSKQLDSGDGRSIAASTIYAIGAMKAGCSYINFTPSVGSNLPALHELAEAENVLHAGRDGKTGETLMKAVLAPMFAARNLKVKSWVGHNIFGNMDGKVLDDPANKASKVTSKDHLLTEILGYKPESLVSIEYIESLGDWKTAWDHIHFDGFLNTRMTLQFTWQGCDSLLAAPLALDLVRFTEREQRRGNSGLMPFLASFFKSPIGTDEPEFARQFQMLGRMGG